MLAGPRCGGRLRLLALIEVAAVIPRILRHLGLPTEMRAGFGAGADRPGSDNGLFRYPSRPHEYRLSSSTTLWTIAHAGSTLRHTDVSSNGVSGV